MALKPLFILNALAAHKKPVLYVDSDLIFLGFPDDLIKGRDWSLPTPSYRALTNFTFENFDFAAINSKSERGEVGFATSSGVLWFNDTLTTHHFLEDWWKTMLFSGNRAGADDHVISFENQLFRLWMSFFQNIGQRSCVGCGSQATNT